MTTYKLVDGGDQVTYPATVLRYDNDKLTGYACFEWDEITDDMDPDALAYEFPEDDFIASIANARVCVSDWVIAN